MNYKKHYELLIQNAKNRILDEYTEIHHILPKCLGGSDNPENLVSLTAREHFIAHLLLVKIYNNNLKLVKAVAIMCIGQKERKINNRLYGKMKILHRDAMALSQTGNKNSQYNTRWIHNNEQKTSIKILKDQELPNGWNEGRKIKFDIKNCCKTCGVEIVGRKRARFCDEHRIYMKPERLNTIRKSLAKIEKNNIIKEIARNQVPSYIKHGWKLVD